MSVTLGWPAVVVVAAGTGLSAGYSVRPVRLADRGAVASMLLPAGYVAVPYLVAVFGAAGRVTAGDLWLLSALYVGFIGRILLKDFRDVRGDALFGKRTFLVRHGRGWTCLFSAVCWVVGTTTMVVIRGADPSFVAVSVVYLALALVLLGGLSADGGPRRDEALISGVAIVGRGMVVSLLAHLSMTKAHWSPAAATSVLVVLLAVVVGQAADMARHGPTTRLTLPPAASHLGLQWGPSMSADDETAPCGTPVGVAGW
jgi:4-hydroxybenzoate polyprenyltransferase